MASWQPAGTMTTTPDGRRWFKVVDDLNVWLPDFGAQLNAQFTALYNRHLHGGPFDEVAFRTAAFAYLDAQHAAGQNPDRFFDAMTGLGIPTPGTPVAWTGVWEWALAIAHDWEGAAPGRRVHKGTGYYFAGMRDIALGDLERGFLYMHQAAVEDRTSTGSPNPPRPAIWFITVDPRDPGQAYHDKVVEYEAVLDGFLSAYRSASRGGLDLVALRDRFTRYPDLLDAFTTLAYVVARTTRLGDPRTQRIRANPFAALILSQVSLQLCLVIEELLRRIITVTGAPTFGKLLARMPTGHAMDLTVSEVSHLNGLFHPTTFDANVTLLLDGLPLPGIRAFTPRETDLAIAYAIRNKTAHGLERPATTTLEFDRIVPRLFYALFAVLESLYP